jgi:formiminotetrahydrofolate cyclodeaminase
MATVSIDVGYVSIDVGYVDVDVDLDKFDDDELVEELESRGYTVTDEPRVLDAEETEVLLKLIDDQDPAPGSQLYFIREKIVNGT